MRITDLHIPAKPVRAYLAGPMRGIPKHNFPTFNLVAERLRWLGWEVFNPADGENPNDPNIRGLMRKDVDWICDNATDLVLLPGWQKSTGAVTEFCLARAIGSIYIWTVAGNLSGIYLRNGDKIKI